MVIERDPISQTEGFCLPVSRAATALYCVLREYAQPNANVLVPANLCYAGVLPIIYAGMRPLFCDVDSHTGNITIKKILEITHQNKLLAIIVPHMYGNPVCDLLEIAELCRKSNILLIEDCASSMGAESNDYVTGCIGDYSVYSTGYSKTLDLGFGGFLISHRNDLRKMDQIESNLDELTPNAQREILFFSQLYRLVRNKGKETGFAKCIYQNMAICLKDSLVYRISEEKKNELVSSLNLLPDIIHRRRSGVETYMAMIKQSKDIENYTYYPKAVPWRFNLFIKDETLRRKIIQNSLEKNLPVSDWYPMVTSIFGDYGYYPSAAKHEREIINYPLLNSDDEKRDISNTINALISE